MMRNAGNSYQLLVISCQPEVTWENFRAGLARSLVATLLALFVACQVDQHLDTAESNNARPKIASARIGFTTNAVVETTPVQRSFYKLGFWTPVRVDVSGAGTSSTLSVEVTVVDSDGVPTTAVTPLPSSSSADGVRTAVVYTMVGRIGNPIRISLLDEENEVDSLALQPDTKGDPKAAVLPIAATSEMIVSLGTTPFGLRDAFGDRSSSSGQPGRKLIELESITELPTEWFGYSAVDALVIAAGDGKLVTELAADKAKFAAIKRWIELGGRLVVFCGAENANELLGTGGPLASLAPGKLAEVVRLPEAGPLERFANVIAPIAGAEIDVLRLTDVDGNIEAYWRSTDLPLVVRTPRGFGEVTFVGVELNRPPLATWTARTAFLRAVLRPYIADTQGNDYTQRLMTSGYNDLSGALRQQLGRSFSLVVPIGFPIVTGLVIAYLLFLGPLDYLVVIRWFRRPLVAWITFPILIAAFSLLAIAIANWSKGSSNTRVNQLQLVDFDMLSGQMRGTYWGALYSPAANQFDLAMKVPPAGGSTASEPEMLFSWWGLPGLGIGGMQTGGADLGIVRDAYRFGPDRDSLDGVPVLSSATKSLFARWNGPNSAKIDSALLDEEGLVGGSITNQTGVTLRNVRLLYGSWGYRLGTLNDGQHIEVSEQLSPRSTKTIVTRDALGQSGATVGEEARVFSADQAAAKDILNLMMFYDVAGGYSFAHLPNRFQAFCDMSRQLELGRAVLVCEAATAGAEMTGDETGQPVGDAKLSTGTVIFRFILPVKKAAAQ